VSEGRYRLLADPAVSGDELEALALEALPLATEAGDHPALVRIWTALGYAVANVRQQMEAWALAAERCIEHARQAGWPHGDAFGLASALVWGPRPADDALRMLDALADELSDPAYELKRAYLLAALTRFDEARAVAGPAGEQLRAFGDARQLEWFADLAALEGDYERAVRYAGDAVTLIGERGLVSIQVGLGVRLGRWLCLLGRPEEAAPHAAFARAVDPGDWSWMMLQARVDAARGDHDAAELMAVEGLRRGLQTDQPTSHGDAWCDLAEVRLAAGRDGDAADAFEQALACYLRKRNLAMADQVRRSLASVRAR
jgi:tetratricopeptide (TPR) repeat protein